MAIRPWADAVTRGPAGSARENLSGPGSYAMVDESLTCGAPVPLQAP